MANESAALARALAQLGGRLDPAVLDALAGDARSAQRIVVMSGDTAPGSVDRCDFALVDAGDLPYDVVARYVAACAERVVPGGVLLLSGDEAVLEAAVRDHLPFAHFRTLGYGAGVLALRRLATGRRMFLCGGMQSSGSSLVSMCFVQRADMDGVYDLDNSLVQQDFSRVLTPDVWVKMTVGSFRLAELADLYTAQGWDVRVLLVYRDPEETLRSLVAKPYGLDGCNGDDPPLLVRLSRYLADVDAAAGRGWPIVDYVQFIRDPEPVLRRICGQLGLPWDDAMLAWPKSLGQIAYSQLGSPSLRATMAGGGGLLATINRYQDGASSGSRAPAPEVARRAALLVRHARGQDGAAGARDAGWLLPCPYRGTHRDRVARELEALHESRGLFEHLLRHRVIGNFIRLWVRLVNPRLKLPEWRTPE